MTELASSGRSDPAASRRILVIDDDRDVCDLLQMSLARHGFDVESASDDESMIDSLEGSFDAAVIDIRLGNRSGLEVCRRVHKLSPEFPVVMITAHGDSDIAIEAMRAGAFDFIGKPFSVEVLARVLDKALDTRQLNNRIGTLSKAVANSRPVGGLLGECPLIRSMSELIRRVARKNATVLVTGESGTGKDLVARAIHECSPRRDGPFLALNCAAQETLLEAELFGHVKGAFTDAHQAKAGMFLDASGGTLFLDEIGDLPLEMQPKLLRVLQERKLRPLGADQELPFDTRIIAATNRDLAAEVAAGRFREDLYYRIDVIRIEAPPLRDRGEDVLFLSQHFLESHAAASGKPVTGITPSAAEHLLAYDWPGNVRELENTIARAVTLTRFRKITTSDLPARIVTKPSHDLVTRSRDPGDLPRLCEVEASYIERVLHGVNGNKTRAARILGLNRRTLYRKVKRLNIAMPTANGAGPDDDNQNDNETDQNDQTDNETDNKNDNENDNQKEDDFS